MASNNTVQVNIEEHKRKLFIQNISSETTQQSLRRYFSGYPIDRAAVPKNDKGHTRLHGIVTFANEASVDAVMEQRGHRIDGKEVFIHRSVPNQGASLKDSCGIQQLIVSISNNRTLTGTTIQEYFKAYGTIVHSDCSNDGKDWTIDFDYYDSVDRILLDCPHCIGDVDVEVKKGNRRSLMQEKTTITESIPRKSSLKQVKMNDTVACIYIPEKRYRVHITNLPNDINAEELSREFTWSIYDIVMAPSDNYFNRKAECWLKYADNERVINNFITKWHEKSIHQSVIHCEKEEDELELCNKFQFGQCTQDNDCHWEHIKCTANGTCASTCPYGHEKYVKSEHSYLNDIKPTSTTYRIKMSGFQKEVTPDYLKQTFGSNNYYIDRKHDRVGYVVKIKTMKFAKKLMSKWHNVNIDEQTIKCQLELNPVLSNSVSRSRSETASLNGEEKRQRSRSRPQDTYSLRSNLEMNKDSTSDFTSKSFDNKELGRDDRISGKAMRDATRVSSQPNIASTINGTKHTSPSGVWKDEWEIAHKASHSDGKVLLIRHIEDRELTTMKSPKDVKGVSHLIEPDSASNNIARPHAANDKQWMITERAPGCSLEEFIQRNAINDLNMLSIVQLTLKLTGILRDLHRKKIFHQNLSPKNIMIEWDRNRSMNDAQLTVINFSQAVRASNRTHIATTSSANKWYDAPQSNDEAFVSTVDASDVCGILFWLLTKNKPVRSRAELPHQQFYDRINDVSRNAAQAIGMCPELNALHLDTRRTATLGDQLKKYLLNTFDRAFGYPGHHPWTLDDLECRLKSILHLLIPVEPKLDAVDGIIQELIFISNPSTVTSTVMDNVYDEKFEKASQAFYQAKKHFIDSGRNQYEWSYGCCTWIHHPQKSINECYNDDILTYHSSRGGTTTTYSIIVRCLAKCSEEGRVIVLSISSDVNGRTIEIPIGEYSTAQNYHKDVVELFQVELKNLLLAVYIERTSLIPKS
ncbi:unnamed protein product [Adineta ricciae]|uniref:Uncharacterized protein n=1 Tax=Adineta ricciae TaxID=249248 RepID=A0A815M5D2_ADIRI|nr:unnamed protein product [Adineta ricciae]